MAPAAAGPPSAPRPPAARAPADPDLRGLRLRWAQLIRRIYEVDPLLCPRCRVTMRIIAFITEPKVVRKILRHLAAKGAERHGAPDSSHNQRPAA